MSENTFDIQTIRQLEALSKSLGGLTECRRLGFVHEDDKGVLSLSSAGLGYLFRRRNCSLLIRCFCLTSAPRA